MKTQGLAEAYTRLGDIEVVQGRASTALVCYKQAGMALGEVRNNRRPFLSFFSFLSFLFFLSFFCFWCNENFLKYSIIRP